MDKQWGQLFNSINTQRHTVFQKWPRTFQGIWMYWYGQSTRRQFVEGNWWNWRKTSPTDAWIAHEDTALEILQLVLSMSRIMQGFVAHLRKISREIPTNPVQTWSMFKSTCFKIEIWDLHIMWHHFMKNMPPNLLNTSSTYWGVKCIRNPKWTL